MKNGNVRDPATVAVYRIVKDLRDRGGLDHVWDSIDVDIQREIVNTWRSLIRQSYAECTEEITRMLGRESH